MAMKISATKDGESNLQQNSHGLFLGKVFVLLLVGMLGLTIWVSELSKSSAKVNEAAFLAALPLFFGMPLYLTISYQLPADFGPLLGKVLFTGSCISSSV